MDRHVKKKYICIGIFLVIKSLIFLLCLFCIFHMSNFFHDYNLVIDTFSSDFTQIMDTFCPSLFIDWVPLFSTIYLLCGKKLGYRAPKGANAHWSSSNCVIRNILFWPCPRSWHTIPIPPLLQKEPLCSSLKMRNVLTWIKVQISIFFLVIFSF